MNPMQHAKSWQRGFNLTEVLVAMVVLSVGLMGLAALQGHAQLIEKDAYRRAIAATLVQDMTDRLMAARGYFGEFNDLASNTPGTGRTYGTGDDAVIGVDCAADADDADGTALTVAGRHLCAWSQAMKGEAEKFEDDTTVAAASGMRGCILRVNPPTDGALAEFYVVGVWRGTTVTADPPAGTPGAACADTVNYGTGRRRTLVNRVLIPTLTGL